MDPTKRFTGLADIYASGRPSYPAEALDFIEETLQLDPSATVADVGCGTGISTRLFAQRGYRVVGVEPNDEMRAKAVEQSKGFANIEYIGGTGENTNLSAKSVNAIVACQAFHWFNPELALREFHRVLKSGGWVILMWNERDHSDDFTRAYGEALLGLPETSKVEMKRGIAGDPLLADESWAKRSKHIFKNSQLMTKEIFLQRAFSASYVPQSGDAAIQLRQNLSDIFDRYSVEGNVVMRYETSVYSAQQPAA